MKLDQMQSNQQAILQRLDGIEKWIAKQELKPPAQNTPVRSRSLASPQQAVVPSHQKHRPEVSPVINHSRAQMRQNPSGSSDEVLETPDEVVQRYANLRVVSKAGMLACKLARFAYFGPKLMSDSTVKGCRDHPALPAAPLLQLKQTILDQFSQFWTNPTEFEPVWETCKDAIGQACKRFRQKPHLARRPIHETGQK